MQDSKSGGRVNRGSETASIETGDGVRRRTILGLAASGGVFGTMGLSSGPTIVTAGDGCDSGVCDLTVTKEPDTTFTFKGGGTYIIEVCNEGSDPCEEPVTVVDSLPPGMAFESASGTDWSVTDNGTEVIFDHPNYTSVQPGSCLPVIELTVRFDPVSDFPSSQVDNCVSVSTCGDVNSDNDEHCEPVCITKTSTFCAGTPDDFDESSSYEPSVQSAGLQAKIDSYGTQREFDEGGANAVFGHSFLNLVPNENYGEICEATLEVRLRPEGESDDNDAIRLDFFDDDASGWSHKIGDYNGEPGLYDGEWDDSNTSGETFTLDLDALPDSSGGTTSILDELNQQGYLDVYVQDDTAVDFLRLTVEYCCPVPCDFKIVKFPIVDFPVGGIGTYAIDVGYPDGSESVDGVEVVDYLPEGFTFHAADGQGWSVDEGDGGDAGTVTAVYDDVIQPGDQLPRLHLDVQLTDEDVFEDYLVVNCIRLDPVGDVEGTESCATHNVTPQ